MHRTYVNISTIFSLRRITAPLPPIRLSFSPFDPPFSRPLYLCLCSCGDTVREAFRAAGGIGKTQERNATLIKAFLHRRFDRFMARKAILFIHDLMASGTGLGQQCFVYCFQSPRVTVSMNRKLAPRAFVISALLHKHLELESLIPNEIGCNDVGLLETFLHLCRDSHTVPVT